VGAVSFGAILLLAVGLAMDATAVAAARGVAATRVSVRDVLLVGALFGGFQGLMPLLGWAVGDRIGPYARDFDHWIAFVVLAGIGAKMLWESRADAPRDSNGAAALGFRVLIVLAVATSVDAFAVGVMLPMMNAPMTLSLVTIGVTTAALSVVGLLAGKRLGAALGPRFDAFGGVLLIGFGCKILVEHLSA
jgi:manganese efflux pump family protein